MEKANTHCYTHVIDGKSGGKWGLEDNVAPAGKKVAKLPPLKPGRAVSLRGVSGSRDIGLSCNIPSLLSAFPRAWRRDSELYPSTTAPATRRDATCARALVSLVDRRNDSRHCQMRNCFGNPVRCADVHLIRFFPRDFSKCSAYMKNWFYLMTCEKDLRHIACSSWRFFHKMMYELCI